MSSKYWPPVSLFMEDNTSDLEQEHCCSEYNGRSFIEEGFWMCHHCGKKVLDTDEALCYYNIVKAAEATKKGMNS